MTKAHRESVLELAPRQLKKTFTMVEAGRLASEFGAQNVADFAEMRSQLSLDSASDIADPIGRDAAFFAAVGSKITAVLQPILRVCRTG